jgi:cytochrome c oxidase subunit II
MSPLDRADLAGSHSALAPAGDSARSIAHLTWILTAVSLVVFVAVVGLALAAALRQRMRHAERDDRVLARDDRVERRLHVAIGSAAIITTLTLIGLLVASIAVGKSLSSSRDPNALEIDVTGHQWWWEVRYPDVQPSNSVTTANEIHVPVGRSVKLVLESRDVIHSFWVPALHGKLDLIPGRKNELFLRADRAGTYGGQCAEFCGLQHAKMALVVLAEPADVFAAWLERMRRPAKPPAQSVAARGQQVFLSTSCPLCHAISGTASAASAGPDLTHFASRRGLAGNSVPNVRGHLAGWLLDPTGIKPGAAMPANALAGPDLQALLAYLETLE